MGREGRERITFRHMAAAEHIATILPHSFPRACRLVPRRENGRGWWLQLIKAANTLSDGPRPWAGRCDQRWRELRALATQYLEQRLR